jgi:hypothetical protein
MTGAVFEWLTSNTFIDYPFVDRQADGLHELFVDAYLIHTKDRDKDALVRLAVFDPAGTAELRFDDNTLLAALTGADNFYSHIFGSYTVYEWRKSTTLGVGFTGEDIIFRLTVHTAKLSSFSFPHPSTTAYLLPSLVNPRIARVRRFATALPGLPCCTGGGITDKSVVLEVGNNMELTLFENDVARGFTLDEGQSVRTPKRIVFDAVGGSGTGAFQTCGSLEAAIRRISGVGVEDNGAFAFEGEDCTWVESRLTPGPTQPPTHPNTDYKATTVENLLQLHGNCQECCSCADYGTVYQVLKDAWDRATQLATTIGQQLTRYNEMSDLWLLIRDAKHNGIHVKLRPIANADFSVAIMWLAYNNTGANLANSVEVTVDLQTGGATYVENSCHIDMETLRLKQINPVIVGNTYTLTLPPLRRAQYATAIFTVRFGDNVPNRSNKVLQLKATATSGAFSDTDNQSVSLVPPLRKA